MGIKWATYRVRFFEPEHILELTVVDFERMVVGKHFEVRRVR